MFLPTILSLSGNVIRCELARMHENEERARSALACLFLPIGDDPKAQDNAHESILENVRVVYMSYRAGEARGEEEWDRYVESLLQQLPNQQVRAPRNQEQAAAAAGQPNQQQEPAAGAEDLPADVNIQEVSSSESSLTGDTPTGPQSPQRPLLRRNDGTADT